MHTRFSLNVKVVGSTMLLAGLSYTRVLKNMLKYTAQRDKKGTRTGCVLSLRMKILPNTLFVISGCSYLTIQTFMQGRSKVQLMFIRLRAVSLICYSAPPLRSIKADVTTDVYFMHANHSPALALHIHSVSHSHAKDGGSAGEGVLGCHPYPHTEGLGRTLRIAFAVTQEQKIFITVFLFSALNFLKVDTSERVAANPWDFSKPCPQCSGGAEPNGMEYPNHPARDHFTS